MGCFLTKATAFAIAAILAGKKTGRRFQSILPARSAIASNPGVRVQANLTARSNVRLPFTVCRGNACNLMQSVPATEQKQEMHAGLGRTMFARLRAFGSGLHFRFMMLVIGMAVALLAAQLVTDTAAEIRKARDQRIADALSVTSIIARSLEKQFDMLELPDIEAILANVRCTGARL